MTETKHERRRGRTIAATLGGLTATAAIGTLSVAYYVVDRLTRPQPLDPQADFTFTPWELDIPSEDVLFPSADGTHTVTGWWLPQANTDRVIICCSGYRGRKADLLGIGSQLWRAGYNALLIDFHGHGVARGEPVTLGYREVADFLGAVEYASQRVHEAQIGAIGFSMGASVVLMGAARDERVHAVVADSPFATHRSVLENNFRRQVPLPPGPFLTVADRILGVQAGYHFSQVEPIQEIAQIAPRPIFLIHCTADIVVPYQESERLYAAANEPKELWIVEGMSHVGAYFLDRPAYCRRVTMFFDRWLSPIESSMTRSEHALD